MEYSVEYLFKCLEYWFNYYNEQNPDDPLDWYDLACAYSVTDPDDLELAIYELGGYIL